MNSNKSKITKLKFSNPLPNADLSRDPCGFYHGATGAYLCGNEVRETFKLSEKRRSVTISVSKTRFPGSKRVTFTRDGCIRIGGEIKYITWGARVLLNETLGNPDKRNILPRAGRFFIAGK
jgi:hypothetical protein